MREAYPAILVSLMISRVTTRWLEGEVFDRLCVTQILEGDFVLWISSSVIWGVTFLSLEETTTTRPTQANYEIK